MLTIDEAEAQLDTYAQPLPIELRALADARGCVLARDAFSAVDLPPFPQSAMDGYAVRAADVSGDTPIPVRGTVFAGRLDAPPVLPPGAAMRIMTGAWVPEGADVVVPQEQASFADDQVRFQGVTAGAHIRPRGEECTAGARVLSAGVRLTPGRIAALSVAGVAEVAVRRIPRVAIVTTGDEVIAPGAQLAPGQVYDGNLAFLTAFCAAHGVELVSAEHVADDVDALTAAMSRARASADLLVTTGGASVGEHDHVPTCAEAAGYERRFWRIAQKPGKPTWFATNGAAAHLGLPGNPGAVVVGTEVYVRRWLDLLQGADADAGVAAAVLAAPVRRHPGVDLWSRVAISVDADGRRWATPLSGQASHMLGNLASCDGIVRVERGEGSISAGVAVTVRAVTR